MHNNKSAVGQFNTEERYNKSVIEARKEIKRLEASAWHPPFCYIRHKNTVFTNAFVIDAALRSQDGVR